MIHKVKRFTHFEVDFYVCVKYIHFLPTVELIMGERKRFSIYLGWLFFGFEIEKYEPIK